MQNKLIALSFIILLAFASNVKGQKLVNSPYSRFNIGSIDPLGPFRGRAMGGSGVAMRDNTNIYFTNPASYSSVDTSSFLFDFAVDYSIMDLNDGKNKYRSDDMNFDHLVIAFPLAKGWGFAAGLSPVSNGYYSISESVTAGDPGYDPSTGPVFITHKGTGGLNNLFVGTGINITKNFSAGINMNVLFGELDRINQFEFADYANTFGQFNSEKLKINGINFDYGLQYTTSFKKDYFLTAGVSITAAKKYRSESEILNERFASYATSLYNPDTLTYYKISTKDSTKFPTTFRFGLSFGKKDKFVAEVDYVYSNWANAKIQGSSTHYLANSSTLSFGIELIPDKYSNLSYLSRIEYRLGGHIGDNYLTFNGARIKEYGASCGFAIRLKNFMSKTNVYFDFTRKNGDLASGMHNENIYSIGASLNLYDWWFQKHKFD
jgi:hypothetical protein